MKNKRIFGISCRRATVWCCAGAVCAALLAGCKGEDGGGSGGAMSEADKNAIKNPAARSGGIPPEGVAAMEQSKNEYAKRHPEASTGQLPPGQAPVAGAPKSK